MKKTLLFTTKNLTFYSLLVCFLCINYGWSQTNLVLNGTGDVHTNDVNDNADAFDMTPPSEIDKVGDVTGTGVNSPYKALWNNTDLDNWLTGSEQPGSTSDGTYNGATKTRGFKISNSTRRLYQKIAVTPGIVYTFSIDSRSEAENIPSEVFILNTEIANETGLTSGSTTVDAYSNITTDFNASTGSETENTFTNTTFNFTASGSFVVIYVRALLANSATTETFYDNVKLFDPTTASVKDVLATKLNIYPNPANDYITIKSNNVKLSSVELYNVLGSRVLSAKTLNNDRLNVSGISKGIYMLKVNAEGASSTKKIIIE